MLFWQISALFFPVFSVSKQFFCCFFYVSPLSLEIRDSSYISKEKKTHHQTNHFRLRLQPVSPPAALLRCPLLSSHLYSSLPLSALSTPADAADMLLHARNDARFGSAVQSGDEVWNPGGGRTAAEISCDSDLLLLLLQDLCRAAPLPPLLPEHTGIPFNSLFLPVVKPPYRHLTATVRTALHYPSVGGTTFLLKCQDVKYAVWKWREGAFNAPPPPPPIPTRCAFTKCGVIKSSERLDELELHLHQTPANDMSELRSLLPPHALSSDLQPAQSCLWRAI